MKYHITTKGKSVTKLVFLHTQEKYQSITQVQEKGTLKGIRVCSPQQSKSQESLVFVD